MPTFLKCIAALAAVVMGNTVVALIGGPPWAANIAGGACGVATLALVQRR